VWLELPATTSGSGYTNKTLYAGNARNYTYLYQHSTYTSLWTAYPLYSDAMGSLKHTGDWTWNSQVSSNGANQVDIRSHSYGVSYSTTTDPNDIYSRGHNIPDADRSGNQTMLDQTYYVTNSTPQIQNKFNGSIWSELEGQVRTIAQSDTVYVVTGCCFNKVGEAFNPTYITPQDDTGKSVPVPKYYWKVLLKVTWSGTGSNKTVSGASAVGIWIPHGEYTKPSGGWNMANYAQTVNQIEEWTGFDFFVNLPQSIEETVESNSSWTAFKNSSNIASVTNNNWGTL
jgi:endonuclease G